MLFFIFMLENNFCALNYFCITMIFYSGLYSEFALYCAYMYWYSENVAALATLNDKQSLRVYFRMILTRAITLTIKP